MNLPSTAVLHLLTVGSTTAAMNATHGISRVADQPSLPWDYTLDVVQSFVTGRPAHAVIVISGVLAALVFAVAGDSEFVRRLLKAVIGTGAALLAVQLLNYLAP
jgi:type IV secretory pathway VirB2 component (pilin)